MKVFRVHVISKDGSEEWYSAGFLTKNWTESTIQEWVEMRYPGAEFKVKTYVKLIEIEKAF